MIAYNSIYSMQQNLPHILYIYEIACQVLLCSIWLLQRLNEELKLNSLLLRPIPSEIILCYL